MLLLPLTVREQWLRRHECEVNDLWRIGSSGGQATHQRRDAVDRGQDRTWRCPLMALSRHPSRACQCPLLGAKRTLLGRAAMSVFDPERTYRSCRRMSHWRHCQGTAGVSLLSAIKPEADDVRRSPLRVTKGFQWPAGLFHCGKSTIQFGLNPESFRTFMLSTTSAFVRSTTVTEPSLMPGRFSSEFCI